MERFQNEGGIDLFEETEAIEFLLDLAQCNGDRKVLAARLLDTFGSLKGVLEAREEQLKGIKGLSKRSILLIRLVVPFVKTWEKTQMEDRRRIGNCYEAEHFCKSLLSGQRNEQFYVICMNAACKVLGTRKIGEGSLNEVYAYPRMVMEAALNYNAYSVLLCHNHPGGTNKPSGEDISSTVMLKSLLNGVGILLLDHIIVAGCETYSMVQHGDIDYRTRK